MKNGSGRIFRTERNTVTAAHAAETIVQTRVSMIVMVFRREAPYVPTFAVRTATVRPASGNGAALV